MAITRLEERVKKLERNLRDAKSRISKEKRQERNGQLVSLGILFEQAFKTMTPEEKIRWKSRAEKLDERNKSRVFFAFQRFSEAAAASSDEALPAGGAASETKARKSVSEA